MPDEYMNKNLSELDEEIRSYFSDKYKIGY